MTYDPNKYSVTAAEVDDEVTEIREGTVKDFVKDFAQYNKNGRGDPKAPAIEVHTAVGCKKMIILPEDGKTQATFGSTLGLWIATYGKAPFKGQKVRATANAKGFYDVKLGNTRA